jgi:hypothetical protein
MNQLNAITYSIIQIIEINILSHNNCFVYDYSDLQIARVESQNEITS